MFLFSFLFLTAFQNFVSAAENNIVVDRIVAVVNSEPILLSDLEQVVKNISKPGLIDETLISPYTMDDLKSNRKAQLNYLIHEKLLSSDIKKLNLSVSAERVEQEISTMAKRAGAPREDLINAIRAQGVSLLEYKAFLKDKIEKQSLVQQEVISKIRISDEDILSEYLKTQNKKTALVSEFTLAHILFNPQKKSKTSALDRAQKVYEKIKAGQSFESAAEQYSEDTQFENNGYFGHFKSGEFLPEIETKFYSMKEGDITPPLQTKMGIHIFKLLSKKVALDANFDSKVKEKISSILLEREFRKQLPLWLEAQRAEAVITINDK